MNRNIEKDKAEIERLWKAGKKDPQIAKETSLKLSAVKGIRSYYGLSSWKSSIDIFNGQSKIASWNDTNEKRKIEFWLPHDIADKLRLKDKVRYEFFGSVDGKTVVLEFVEAD